MIRIGIVGSDNSHGLAFAKLVNFADEKTGEFVYPDLRITAIYGHDREHTDNVAKEGGFEEVVHNAGDLIGKTDAVMVIFRHGSLHAEYALPFIEAGMPVWVDKPFASSAADAEKIIAAAKKKNVLLSGGSTIRFAKDVDTLGYAVAHDYDLGAVKSGYLNFPGDTESVYDGIYFYGIHIVEMMIEIFGEKVISVTTHLRGRELVCVADYENFGVILDFAQGVGRHFGIVHGENKTMIRDIDSSATYRLGFDDFYKMLKTKTNPRPLDCLLPPIKVVGAIERSLKEKRTVKISEI